MEFFLLRLIVALTFITILPSCANNQEKTSPVLEKVTESVYASGIIKAKNQYQVFPIVSGVISKIYVTENDLVKVGSPLVLISDETSKINSLNASLVADYANIEANKEKLNDLKNNITLAANKYGSDSLIFKRQQHLWNQNIGSKLELEQKELACQNSKTALASAKIKYIELLKQLQFHATQSKNNLAMSRYKESDFTIKSEIDGRVYLLNKKKVRWQARKLY